MADNATGIMARFERLKTARGASDSYWQQVADYMIPSREFTRKSVPGGRRSASVIYNTAPILALEQLAGALHGMLTSASLRWFALRPPITAMLEDEKIRGWYEAATDAMYSAFTNADAGFDTALHEVYLDLAGFGNGVLYMPDRGLRGPGYQARPLSECFVAENADGKIDTVFRSYSLPAREVVFLWQKALPEKVLTAAEKNPDKPMAIIHAVYPSKDRKTWDECYVLTSEKLALEHGVYKTFPYAVPRWSKRSGETYGAGPGMNALPDVKLLNKLDELNLRGTARVIAPTILLPDDGWLSTPTMSPGEFVYYRSGAMGMDKIQVLPGGQANIAHQQIGMIEERVRNIFYVAWMNLPQQPNMTATEVLQRRDEMLRLLGPMVARVTRELLAPVIERTFFIMVANDKLPPLPPGLDPAAGYEIDYISPLATAQRASDADTVMKWFAALAQLAQVDPTVVQVVNTEQAARFLAARYGAPASVVRSPDEMAAIRQAAEQKAQQEHNMAATATAARAANDGAGALASLASAAAAGQPPQAAA